MNVWLIPTSSPIWNTFIRSIVLMLVMIFGLKYSFYQAYWGAVIHDGISLLMIRDMV